MVLERKISLRGLSATAKLLLMHTTKTCMPKVIRAYTQLLLHETRNDGICHYFLWSVLLTSCLGQQVISDVSAVRSC